MKRANHLLPVCLWLSLLAVSCGKEPKEDPKLNYGFNYLPLNEGFWVEYHVDSIVFDEFSQTSHTYTFTLRETVAEQYKDGEGRTVYRIERARRWNDTAGFQVAGSYALLKHGSRAERVDNNLRVVPLIFPPRADENWNGNAFNARAEQLFEYDYVDHAGSYASHTFDSTLRVIHWNDTNNFVIKRFSEERYARNVGLIYREYFDIETQFAVDSGLHWIQVVTDYAQ